ncbi:MAG: carboxypeptidase-like regulatory domain-containing protein [Prevotella sp.]|nr:carboxypeptidase-like regulatory domain-containing protein [Prevotella sp.]
MAATALGQTYTVRGKVVTDHDGEAASFAIVSIQNQELRTLCDIDGRFELRNVPAGTHTLEVECLGYVKLKRQFTANKNIQLSLQLQSSSFALPEFEVMAKKSRKGKVIIDEAALEYIQPTSLADVMLLLPGSIYKENNLTQFSQISSRQVGSDANSSLGVGVITDGAPVTSDGIRSQLVGITEGSGSYDGEVRSRTGINQGTDMRYISTDHIQSVEFTRGISSARYGNLSSGMISISSKHGVTPLRVRLKSDLKNKLVYAGKGWRLGDRTGTLHAGIDYLHSINDIREEMDKFSRLTAQVYYNNKLQLGDYSLTLDGRLSQTVTVSKMKKDELTYEYDETYKADYARTALMMKGNLTLGKTWLDQLELTLSADYTRDKITRHRLVLSGSGPMNMPLAYEEGEHEGIYLPRKYYSDFYIDNQPVNIYAQLNATSRIPLLGNTMLHLQYGAEYTNVKNHGAGAVIEDETRPPFPYDNSYMRPRPNYAIPALGTAAAYVQADFIYDDGERNVLQLSLGGRASMLTNLPSDYYLHNRVLTDPRVNLSYTIGTSLKNTFRMGFGTESKTPTLDYLYPEKLYKDFYMLNAYTNDPQYRHLITYTNIYDVANRSLKANSNKKLEAGWDLDYRGLSLSFTAFYEQSDAGFEYFTQYHPLTYDLYTTLRPGVSIEGRTPQKSDYVAEQYSLFTTSEQVMNSSKVTKRGIEYRLIFPKIKPLLTTVEINGAYYQTDYASSLPLYYYPAVKIGGKEYPYVCIYDNDARNQYRRLNSNIWFNTHIPKFRLFLTNFFQVIWLNTSQYKDNHDYIPTEYIDMNGQRQPVDEPIRQQIAADDGTFRYFRRTILPVKYARNEKPVSLLWNIKATKEFSKGTKLSFFVNGLLDISPKYLSGSKITQREWHDPYFGLELYFNFNL